MARSECHVIDPGHIAGINDGINAVPEVFTGLITFYFHSADGMVLKVYMQCDADSFSGISTELGDDDSRIDVKETAAGDGAGFWDRTSRG